jgi:hypothetical protein
MVSAITVSSVFPMVSDNELKEKGQMILSVRKNGDKEKGTIAESRHILMPEIRLGLREDGLPSKFVEYIRGALYETAKKQLTKMWDDAGNSMFVEVPANIWNVDSLLLFASLENESTRLTKESISAWFIGSELLARIQAIENTDKRIALQKKYADAFTKCAAPQIPHSLNACEDLKKKLESVESEAERDSTVFRGIMARLNSRIVELQKATAFVAEDF